MSIRANNSQGDVEDPTGVWRGLVDDAAVFPPGNSPLPNAVEAWQQRRDAWWSGLAGTFVVTDLALPDAIAAAPDLPVSVVITGGAGNLPGVCRLTQRADVHLAGLEVALRDPDDLPGVARRVTTALDHARDEGTLADDTTVFVELPLPPDSPGWLAAADVVAECDLRLKFRTGGVEAHFFPDPEATVAGIDAALDRETPFKCTAGLHHAVGYTDAETGFDHVGFLNVLLATRDLLDGAGRDEAVRTLISRDADAIAARIDDDLVARTRRWFTGFGSCSVTDPRDDLVALDLMKEPV